MINGENITRYETKNKIYIPTTYLNQNYRYTLNNNEITIITNNNCYTNYNSTYCDCYRYNEMYNVITESYSCNSNPGNYELAFTSLSDNLNDSYRITRDFTNDYNILIGIVLIAIGVVLTFKKNSRRI